VIYALIIIAVITGIAGYAMACQRWPRRNSTGSDQ
jgi:hypothetical protein